MFAAAAATVLNYQVYNYRRERRLLLLKNIPAQSSRDEIENLCRGQLDDTGSFVLFWLPVVDSLTHQHPGWAMLGFPSRRATALALHRLRGLSQHGQALQFVRASRRQRLRRGRGAARRNDMPRELTAPDEPPAPFHPAPLPPSPPNPPFWSLSRQPRRTTIEVVEQLLPWASAQMLLFVAGIPSGVAKDEFDDAFKRLLARDHATLSLRLRPEGLPQPEHSQGVFLLVTTGQPSSWYLYDRLRTLTVAGRGLVVSQHNCTILSDFEGSPVRLLHKDVETEATQGEISQEEISQGGINQEQINKGQNNQEQINQEQINQEQINQEQINQEQINQEQINQEQISYAEARHNRTN